MSERRHEAAGKVLAGLANAKDKREAVNLLMKTAGSAMRWEGDETWDEFRTRAKPDLERIRRETGRDRS